jgi:hypothetical protein
MLYYEKKFFQMSKRSWHIQVPNRYELATFDFNFLILNVMKESNLPKPLSVPHEMYTYVLRRNVVREAYNLPSAERNR